jgi:adenylate kinase
MSVYFIGGVNGVGKSSFLNELTSKYPEFYVVKGSSALMQWLGLNPGDYDKLRAMPEDYKTAQFDLMMENLLIHPPHSDGIMLIDAHYFHYNEGNLVDTTGTWISKMDALFVITAGIDEVYSRVAGDSKERNLFPKGSNTESQKDMLELYSERTTQKARELSEKYDIPYYLIENKQGKMEQVINTFLEIHP